MKNIEITSWENFKEELSKIEQETNKLKETCTGHVSLPIFRGQRNSNWKLETTLERHGAVDISMESYDSLIRNILGTVRGIRSDFNDLSLNPLIQTYREIIKSDDSFKRIGYMAYLRHYGFPSPLLDWSRSPYIAAFFAFSGVEEDVDKVSIYYFREYKGQGKGGWGKRPRIEEVNSIHHETWRHFAQQGQYTLCLCESDKGDIYVSHESFFEKEVDQDEQDSLVKYDLPATEKEKALREMDLMNINSFSLFNSEEGLMQLLTYRWLVNQR